MRSLQVVPKRGRGAAELEHLPALLAPDPVLVPVDTEEAPDGGLALARSPVTVGHQLVVFRP